MRKSKEIKRKRKMAGLDYKKGKRTEAYKGWYEAAAEYKARLAPKPKSDAGQG